MVNAKYVTLQQNKSVITKNGSSAKEVQQTIPMGLNLNLVRQECGSFCLIHVLKTSSAVDNLLFSREIQLLKGVERKNG